MAGYRPGKCLLPEIMRDRSLEPYEVYNDPQINMSKQQFSDYYTGRKLMSRDTLKTFAEYFGLPMDDFYVWIKKRIKHME